MKVISRQLVGGVFAPLSSFTTCDMGPPTAGDALATPAIQTARHEWRPDSVLTSPSPAPVDTTI
jgi:hypothetical protein